MKIAMIGHKRLPSREGGVEIAAQELAIRMVRLGHSVDVYNRMGSPYSALASGYDAKKKSFSGVRIITVPTLPFRNVDAVVSSLLASVRVLFGGYDVVHYHAEGSCAMLFLPRLFGIRTVATIHGLDWQRSKWGRFASWYLRQGERIAARCANELIVLSQNMRRYFKETYHREALYLPNGIFPAPTLGSSEFIRELGLSTDGYILITARLVPEKGIHYAINAFGKIDTDKQLVIAGDTAYPNAYIRELQALAAKDKRVRLIGFVTGRTLLELYENCFLFLLPSDLEGMSLSLLEALGSGCRCLASDIPENTEVGGDFAAYFRTSSEASLESALRDILENRREFLPKPVISKAFQEKYSWDEITARTLEVYAGGAGF